ncbi:hypothetical protein WDU94_013282 [Cyamophila willieti]
MRYLLISAYLFCISYDVQANWRNYFKNTHYMTKTKSTTKHYKHSVYFTLESLFPDNKSTPLYDRDLTQMPDDWKTEPPWFEEKWKWCVGNRSIKNLAGRARKINEKNISRHLKKKIKWEKRYNWTYFEVPINKSSYGRKPNIYLLYKSLLGGWKHNDIQQYWNVRLPNDGLI